MRKRFWKRNIEKYLFWSESIEFPFCFFFSWQQHCIQIEIRTQGPKKHSRKLEGRMIVWKTQKSDRYMIRTTFQAFLKNFDFWLSYGTETPEFRQRFRGFHGGSFEEQLFREFAGGRGFHPFCNCLITFGTNFKKFLDVCEFNFNSLVVGGNRGQNLQSLWQVGVQSFKC